MTRQKSFGHAAWVVGLSIALVTSQLSTVAAWHDDFMPHHRHTKPANPPTQSPRQASWTSWLTTEWSVWLPTHATWSKPDWLTWSPAQTAVVGALSGTGLQYLYESFGVASLPSIALDYDDSDHVPMTMMKIGRA